MNSLQNEITFDPAGLLEKYLDSEAVDRYFDLLMSENKKVNLVSRETSRASYDRMVAECLLPLEVIEGTFARYLDIGAGGGLPGVPLLLAKKRPVAGPSVMIERTSKKLNALERICRGLGLVSPAVQFVNKTFEEYRPAESFDLITLRFVKLTRELLKRIVAQLGPSGRFLYYSEPDFEIGQLSADIYSFRASEDQAVKHFTILRKM